MGDDRVVTGLVTRARLGRPGGAAAGPHPTGLSPRAWSAVPRCAIYVTQDAMASDA
jgi:hypothetical protein